MVQMPPLPRFALPPGLESVILATKDVQAETPDTMTPRSCAESVESSKPKANEDCPTLVEVFAEMRACGADPSRILKLRKVQHLGHRPEAALEKHFSQMPGFQRVLVAYSHTKVPTASGEPKARCKPSGLAFVLFAGARFVDLALKQSPMDVAGVQVPAARYEPDEAPKQAVRSSSGAARAEEIVEGKIFAL
jgi:hypothetical protein